MPLGVGLGSGSPTPAQSRVYPELPPPADFTFEIGPWNQFPDGALPSLTQRTVIWRTGPGDNSECSFTIDGRRAEASLIQELESCVGVRRDGKLLYRGLVGVTADTIDADSHTVQVNTADMRAALARRFIDDHDSLVYSTTDQGQIGWDLINVSQSRPAGSLGIIQGTIQPSASVSQTFTAGAALNTTIDTMAQSTNTFDWDITPIDGSTQYTYDVWAPFRGVDRQTVLDYPGRIQSLTRNVDPGTFANAIRATGASGLAAQLLDSSTITTDGAPRMEALVADTNIATLSALASWAQGQLNTLQTVTPSYTVTLAPNAWGGPQDFWLGDPILLSVQSGRLNVLESIRVIEIQLTLDDASDAATVAVTLGAPKVNRRWLLRKIDQRLKALEKR